MNCGILLADHKNLLIHVRILPLSSTGKQEESYVKEQETLLDRLRVFLWSLVLMRCVLTR